MTNKVEKRRKFAMKFRDLFLPKIAQSDPEVRKKAVRNTKNISLLKQVSKKDKNPEVRNLALKQIRKLSILETTS
jgi:hypothetical protein